MNSRRVRSIEWESERKNTRRTDALEILGVYEFSFGDGQSGLTNQYSIHIYRISDLKVGCVQICASLRLFRESGRFPLRIQRFRPVRDLAKQPRGCRCRKSYQVLFFGPSIRGKNTKTHQEGGQRERGGVPLFVLSSKNLLPADWQFSLFSKFTKKTTHTQRLLRLWWISLIRRDP